MRYLLAFALSILALARLTTSAAQADEVKRFERPDFGLAFEYPARWSIGPEEPHDVLPNQLLEARATGAPMTGFGLAVYRLDAVVTADTLDVTLEMLDRRVEAWVAGLPDGNLVTVFDVTVDDADGREYGITLQRDGQPIRADLIVVLNGDRAFEISQWAPEAEYDAHLSTFDAIFNSLVLPWTPATAVKVSG